ncbi:diaminopimelate epimerase [bacterium]|nr:diaminopimelate epimerase [bacterium]
MRLRFTKMHGLGNDFVVIDAISQRVKISPAIAQRIADRHTGIGCDQILLVEAPSVPTSDFCYRIFNADGSEVENCGNGARCFAKFVIDRKLTGKSIITVETAGGIIVLKVQPNGQVMVDMGEPMLAPNAIPFQAATESINYTVQTSAGPLTIGAVSMGNPHAVITVDHIEQAPVATLGPEVGQHPTFSAGVNVGFMAVRDKGHIDLRVFERGVGETLACGTGACAAVVIGRLQHQLNTTVNVSLPGGSLVIDWQGLGHSVHMTGPAEMVFHGQIRL